MAFQPVSNAYMAEIRLTWNGEEVENTLYFRYSTVPSETQAQLLADLLEQWWIDDIQPLQGITTIFREVYVRDLSTTPFIQKVATSAAGAAGTASGASEKNAITKSLIFRSSLSGRSSRGANRLIGLTETQTNINQLEASVQSAYLLAYAGLNTAVSAASVSHCIVSRVTNGEPRPAGETYLVTGYSMPNSILGTMRSRIPVV